MADLFQLNKQELVSFVGTSNPEAAKTFYRDTLGLQLVSEQLPFALVFDSNGSTIRVSIMQNLTPAEHTVLGWNVADILLAAKTLTTAGVEFTRYPGMEQDEWGVWTAPGGAKVAWFKDPDGNTLSLSQLNASD
jgi:catechol 2,3-dioxygenase-like lactoylglutathione lyase family enzyme